MSLKIYFILTIFALPLVISNPIIMKYCYMRGCEHGTHTICKYQTDQPGEACGRVIRMGFTPQEVARILEVHNTLRAIVYSGYEERGLPGPQPSAMKVQLLEWDEELAFIAQRWSQQCINENDVCRKIDKCTVGQNIGKEAYFEGMTEDIELMNLEYLIRQWSNEVEKYNKNDVEGFSSLKANNTSTSRYTQMVWGNTVKIGCGATRYENADGMNIFAVCNYAPSGNNDREPVYETGGKKKSV